jgi:hypothetical protein
MTDTKTKKNKKKVLKNIVPTNLTKRLPKDILAHILSYCDCTDNIELLQIAKKVSSDFNEIIYNIFVKCLTAYCPGDYCDEHEDFKKILLEPCGVVPKYFNSDNKLLLQEKFIKYLILDRKATPDNILSFESLKNKHHVDSYINVMHIILQVIKYGPTCEYICTIISRYTYIRFHHQLLYINNRHNTVFYSIKNDNASALQLGLNVPIDFWTLLVTLIENKSDDDDVIIDCIQNNKKMMEYFRSLKRRSLFFKGYEKIVERLSYFRKSSYLKICLRDIIKSKISEHKLTDIKSEIKTHYDCDEYFLTALKHKDHKIKVIVKELKYYSDIYGLYSYDDYDWYDCISQGWHVKDLTKIFFNYDINSYPQYFKLWQDKVGDVSELIIFHNVLKCLLFLHNKDCGRNYGYDYDDDYEYDYKNNEFGDSAYENKYCCKHEQYLIRIISHEGKIEPNLKSSIKIILTLNEMINAEMDIIYTQKREDIVSKITKSCEIVSQSMNKNVEYVENASSNIIIGCDANIDIYNLTCLFNIKIRRGCLEAASSVIDYILNNRYLMKYIKEKHGNVTKKSLKNKLMRRIMYPISARVYYYKYVDDYNTSIFEHYNILYAIIKNKFERIAKFLKNRCHFGEFKMVSKDLRLKRNDRKKWSKLLFTPKNESE